MTDHERILVLLVLLVIVGIFLLADYCQRHKQNLVYQARRLGRQEALVWVDVTSSPETCQAESSTGWCTKLGQHDVHDFGWE